MQIYDCYIYFKHTTLQNILYPCVDPCAVSLYNLCYLSGSLVSSEYNIVTVQFKQVMAMAMRLSDEK